MQCESSQVAVGGVRGRVTPNAARTTLRACATSHLSHLIPVNPAQELSLARVGRRSGTATLVRNAG